jgi:hypothetical protein
MFRLTPRSLSVYGFFFLLAGCAPWHYHTAPPSPPARPAGPLYAPWMYANPILPADIEGRNLDREFRAGRLGVEEYRERKRALAGAW